MPGVARVRHEMHERHEEADRAGEDGAPLEPERARPHRLAQGDAGRGLRRRARARARARAVGIQSARLRPVLDQERGDAAEHERARGEDLERAPPAERLDELRRDERDDEVADADAGHREAGSEPALPDEPRLHRADARNVDAADAEPDADAVGDVERGERVRPARPGEPEREEDDPGCHHAARPEAVGELAGERADHEVEEPADREHERNVAAARGELLLERAEERRERVRDAEDDDEDGVGRRDDDPAVEHWR